MLKKNQNGPLLVLSIKITRKRWNFSEKHIVNYCFYTTFKDVYDGESAFNDLYLSPFLKEKKVAKALNSPYKPGQAYLVAMEKQLEKIGQNDEKTQYKAHALIKDDLLPDIIRFDNILEPVIYSKINEESAATSIPTSKKGHESVLDKHRYVKNIPVMSLCESVNASTLKLTQEKDAAGMVDLGPRYLSYRHQ